jgi:RimJ/RimL family protein N-acetyltransferase
MLQGERVRLRALERGDLPTMVRWFNDPEVRRRLARVEPMSLAEEERWFDALLRATTEVVFGIVDSDVFVGTCGLHRIDWRNRSALLGIVLGDVAHRGRGLGTDAVQTLLRHAFANLGLHRVELEVLADNAPAIRCYERVGFTTEGIRRDARYLDGAFVDLVVMGILASEWSSSSPSRRRRRR